MNTLAIFGDSYARKDADDIYEQPWHNFIKDYNIKNFGEPGSDLWFSYNLFLKNHSKFDKIIFLVTAPHRIRLIGPNTVIYHNQSYTTASIKASLATDTELDQYNIVLGYYEFIHNKEKEEKVYQLIIDDIFRIRPDAIVYPCFDNNWSSEMPLYNITKFEDSYLGMTDARRQEFYRKGLRDSRACHMIEENNLVVANMFLSKLDGTNKPMGQLTKPNKDVEYYYQSKWN